MRRASAVVPLQPQRGCRECAASLTAVPHRQQVLQDASAAPEPWHRAAAVMRRQSFYGPERKKNIREFWCQAVVFVHGATSRVVRPMRVRPGEILGNRARLLLSRVLLGIPTLRKNNRRRRRRLTRREASAIAAAPFPKVLITGRHDPVARPSWVAHAATRLRCPLLVTGALPPPSNPIAGSASSSHDKNYYRTVVQNILIFSLRIEESISLYHVRYVWTPCA